MKEIKPDVCPAQDATHICIGVSGVVAVRPVRN